MRKFLILPLALLACSAAADESTVILPLEAQTCNLPSAPARVAKDATYEDLVEAKGDISQFQADMERYRACLDKSREDVNLTEGNEVALNEAHNYSVEMEERVAEQFNVAVRAYKERQAEQAE
ncbi:MAG: hypothetical protein GTN86_00645 [Xanthomonadales bacterium]|nr:hypothetical protein [Xanthomonadales bacterium]NIN58319.1 hypothetical protein [Xanthomonadales bacterium]NIN73664.1 hypothetical protein [Xanthomonadales bacterium]NIO14449.1 hypothetical protein [Xanthomonadales bacterium]NIP10712.1 hypothetical protein [Xanthomonadales bacterium]